MFDIKSSTQLDKTCHKLRGLYLKTLSILHDLIITLAKPNSVKKVEKLKYQLLNLDRERVDVEILIDDIKKGESGK